MPRNRSPFDVHAARFFAVFVPILLCRLHVVCVHTQVKAPEQRAKYEAALTKAEAELEEVRRKDVELVRLVSKPS